jgi:predicted amidohydrolase
MRSFRLAVVQTDADPVPKGLQADPFLPDFRFDDLAASVDACLAYYAGLAERAADKGADCVLLTEDLAHLWAPLLYLDDRGIFRRITDHVTGAVPRVFGGLAARRGFGGLAARRGIHVVAGYFRAEGAVITNVAELFGPDGTSLGAYRKVHLPAYERWQVTPGDAFPVFQSDLGRIGMLICYDQNWPEAFASLAQGGAEVVLHPSAATVPEHRMLCRSADHHLFYASACPRGSMIASPIERILARGSNGGEELVAADLDAALGDFGDHRYYDALFSGVDSHRARMQRERRPETYALLTEPEAPALCDPGLPELARSDADVERIYRIFRDLHRAGAQGRPGPYHWDYARHEAGDAGR